VGPLLERVSATLSVVGDARKAIQSGGDICMTGLDGRHRDRDGRIEKKHGNTKMKNLKDQYPELKHFRD